MASSSNRMLQQIHQNLAVTINTMARNIERVEIRGERLEMIEQHSQSLLHSSTDFKREIEPRCLPRWWWCPEY